MLIEARIENHRSIRDEQALTMEAAAIGDPDDPRPRQVEGSRESLLPVAALYGANASGKSNVLSGLAFMRDAVILSHNAWPPGGGVARDPFAWGEKRNEPTLCEATFLMADVRYQYGFTASNDRFIEEWLYAWPNRRKQVWFERDGEKFSFGEKLHGENRLVEQVTRPNALFLSAAVQLRHTQLRPVYDWFGAIQTINVSSQVKGDPHPIQLWLAELELPRSELVEELLELLRMADIGIVDLKLETDEKEEATGRFALWNRRRRIIVRHRNSSEAWLPLAEESKGTRTLFDIGPALLEALAQGSLLLIDELESSLHPLLATKLIDLINNPKSNPRNAQLIFATHDTHLLGTMAGEPALRRDQIWLTAKDDEGATHLYPLTDYKPRKAENLERGYLQGRYGAIPYLGDLVTRLSHRLPQAPGL